MAYTLRGHAHPFPSGSTGTSASIPSNSIASLAINDIVVIGFYVDTNNISITPPAGWTLIDNKNQPAGPFNQVEYYHVVTGSEPTNWVWTLGSSVFWDAELIAFIGGNTSTPLDAHNIATGNVAASLTFAGADAVILFTNNFGGANVAASGFTMVENGDGLGMGYVIESAAGSTGSVTVTGGSGAQVVALIALAPAGAGGSTFTRTVPASAALLATNTRTIPASAALLATNKRTVPASAALLATLSRTVPTTAALQATLTRTIPASASLKATTARTIPATVALSGTGSSRVVPATVALKATLTRTVPTSAALLATLSRTVPSSVALLSTLTRTIPSSAALKASPTRTVLATAALLATNTRTVPATVALSAGGTSSRTVPASVSLLGTATRTVSASLALLATNKRTIPSSAALLATLTRTVPTSAALLATLSRSIPSSAALKATQTRTIPASVALFRQSFAGALKGSFVSTSRFLATITSTSRHRASFLSGSRLKASFSAVSRYSVSLLSGSRLKASFVRSVTMAQPFSTVDVTATILKSDNSVPTVSTLTVSVLFPDGSTGTYALPTDITSLGGGQYKLTYTTKGVGPHRETWIFTATDTSVGEFENVTSVSF